MTEQLPSSAIEDKVRAALSTPEPDPLFVERLEAQLLTQSSMQPGQANRRSAGWFPTRLVCSRQLRCPAWGVALALLALLAIFLAVGPQRVLAAETVRVGALLQLILGEGRRDDARSRLHLHLVNPRACRRGEQLLEPPEDHASFGHRNSGYFAHLGVRFEQQVDLPVNGNAERVADEG